MHSLRTWLQAEFLGQPLFRYLLILAIFAAAFVVTWIFDRLLLRWARGLGSHEGGATGAEHARRSLKGILVLVKAAVWILAAVLVLDNLGIKVSAFMAGLGITGIAVALAAQAVLGDLFAYFVIVFDQPFQVGHVIKVGDVQGEVESVGIKTTRIRALGGEVVVLSNKQLTDGKVQNFRLLQRRRAEIHFEVEPSTPGTQLREIPALAKSCVEGESRVGWERCHFKEFGSAGLKFEVVFFVESPEYGFYLDTVQEFNLRLKMGLELKGIQLVFPARGLLKS